MSISLFGIVFMLVTLFFCRKKSWFTYWYVFSNTLFYSSIATVGTSIIKPFHFTTIIMFFVFVRQKIITKNSFREKDTSSLFLFLLWIFISFMLSFLLTNIYVISEESSYKDYDKLVQLEVTFDSISQLLFPAFSIMSFFICKAYISTVQDIKDFTRAYFFSFIPLSITVCILFTLTNIVHNSGIVLAFFQFINPVFTRNVAGSNYNSLSDITRTFTYVGEASYTAKYYMVIMSLFLGFLLFDNNTNRKKYLLGAGIMLMIALTIILGSTTGYAGAALLFFVFTILNYRYKRSLGTAIISNNNFITFSLVFFFVISIPLCFIFLEQISFFINYLVENHIQKISGESGSGVTRFNTNLIALEVFLKSPIFGVGYGHNRTNSFFTFLLSNLGIIGFILINFFCFYLIIKPLRRIKYIPYDLRKYVLVYVGMFIVSYIIQFAFAGSVSISFGWFWVNAALLARLCKFENLQHVEDLHTDQ